MIYTKKKNIEPRDLDKNFHGYQEWYWGFYPWYRGYYKHGERIGYAEKHTNDVGIFTAFYIK
jgi:hypothetical protein